MRAFRFISEGVFKDILGGRVVVHMGRRIDAVGNLIDGEIVRDHSLSDEKVAAWVRAGRAEYVGAVENVVDKITGAVTKTSGPSLEAQRETAVHQQTATHTDAVLRTQALADLRRIMEGAEDEERELAEMELADVPTPDLREHLDSVQRERDRRQSGAKPMSDAEREAAETRILALYDDPVFSDKERIRADKGVRKIPSDKLAVAEADIAAERDRRKAKAAQPDIGGAGPGGDK